MSGDLRVWIYPDQFHKPFVHGAEIRGRRDGVEYVRADEYNRVRAALRILIEHDDITTESLKSIYAAEGELRDWKREADYILEQLGELAIRVREGGGREDLRASLATTVAALARRAGLASDVKRKPDRVAHRDFAVEGCDCAGCDAQRPL